ncbi:MAG: 16S rRNA (uracil(1498)-N(3))-methyltransferase [Deltaproteobacteria bacterium]|nr:16S rRNA (uracil(1498)-N(3))-methyltransferase [Deltaproteobacteria bacterium]
MTRIHLDRVLAPGDAVPLPDTHAHHLGVVLRLQPGAEFEVIDRSGARFGGRLVAGPPLGVEVLDARSAVGTDLAGELEVWLPLLKGGRSDDLVRQLTELGATRIVPWTGRRSVARAQGGKSGQKLARWRTIAREACQQCGRARAPEVAEPGCLPDAGPGVFFYEGGGALAREALAGAVEGGRLRVLTGPEGGLDPDEVEQLRRAGWVAAHLGPRVLRADTAVLCAATLALHALGEGGF